MTADMPQAGPVDDERRGSKLLAFVRQRTDLPDAELAWLAGLAERRSLQEGASLSDIGERRHKLAFLEAGILQTRALTSQGENVVLDFSFAGSMVLPLAAAIRGSPSEVAIEAITPSIVWTWHYTLRLTAFERHPGWRRLETSMTEDAFVRKNARYLSLRTQDARERFRDLDQEFPPEWRDIPGHLVASYLSITPQYLSALRKESRSRER